MISLEWVKEIVYRWKVKSRSSHCIAPTAMVAYRKIAFMNGRRLAIGEGSIVQARIVSEREGAVVEIGCNTFIGSSEIISAQRVTIGDGVLISWGCHLIDHDSHSIAWSKREHD